MNALLRAAPLLLVLSLPLLLYPHWLTWGAVGILFLLNLFAMLVTVLRLTLGNRPPDF